MSFITNLKKTEMSSSRKLNEVVKRDSKSAFAYYYRGLIYDEQKNAGKMGTTLFTTLENGDRVQATISRGNRIYLTVNDLPCSPER